MPRIDSQTNSSITANAQTVVLDTTRKGAASVTLSGTWSGTVQFEASTDNSTWVSIPATPIAGGAAVTSATANGTWTLNVQAFAAIRVRSSAWSSGTVVVAMRGALSPLAFTSGAIPVANSVGQLTQDAANLSYNLATHALSAPASSLSGLLTLLAGMAVQGPNGASLTFGVNHETLTLSTIGLTTNTVGNLLPANSLIIAVATFLTVAITTATNWAVGDATTATRFSAANATKAQGTAQPGLDHWSGAVTTLAAGPSQVAAAPVRITCTGSNPGAGAVSIGVIYATITPPTS